MLHCIQLCNELFLQVPDVSRAWRSQNTAELASIPKPEKVWTGLKIKYMKAHYMIVHVELDLSKKIKTRSIVEIYRN